MSSTRYNYLTHIVEDLMEEVLTYVGEVEHQFHDLYREMEKEELFEDFGGYMSIRAQEVRDED